MTTVRLAFGGSGKRVAQALPPNMRPPALLVSFAYLREFLRVRHLMHFRDWSMDSGAFSAYQLGININLDEYIETCKVLRATDPQLVEVFSLDVIGDWKASLRNTEKMWAAGVPSIPTFHLREPEHVLLTMAREYPKVALGGGAHYRRKDIWAEQCFARIWPHRIHGLAYGSEKSIMLLPWESVDATNWEIGPTKFGSWKTYGNLSVRGEALNLRVEVDHYLAVEDKARVRWAKEMQLIQAPQAVKA